MITAFQLIFSPFETWEKITVAQRGYVWILLVHLLPLLIVCLGLEGFMLNRWGEKQGDLDRIINVPVWLAFRYAATYFLILLAAVFVGAKFLGMASESFNVQTSYLQSLVVMAYGYGPIILIRVLDGFPQVNTWVCWVLGVAGTVSVLYHGIGMVLRPDQTKGFGLYLVAIVIVVLMSGLGHFAAISVLQGTQLRSVASALQAFGYPVG